MEVLDRIAATLSSIPAIRLAAVFGSTARGDEQPGSDVDLGLILDPDTPHLRLHVEASIGRSAARGIDVVYLDAAPALLRFEIARDGILLRERRPHDWANFRARAMIDWWDWAPTARMINDAAIRRLRRERAPRMVRPDVARQKIAHAASRLEQAESLVARPLAEFLADPQARDLASFCLLLAIQDAIDLAAHWIADSGWPAPADASSTFDLLASHTVIDRELAEGLRGAAGLRNRIAHGYADLDHARLHAEFALGVATLRRFFSAVADAAGI